MTTDNFTEAARAEAEKRNPSTAPNGLTRANNAISRREFTDGAEWARTHLAAHDARVRRDAAREALDGLAEQYEHDAYIRAYRDTHYPEETP